METWDIAKGNWEAQLIAKAEQLRPLAEEAYGYSPDTWNFMQHADRIPMTYNYAHALADFATLRKDISIKSVEWGIKKIELLGLMRKRDVRFAAIAEAERELREIERNTEKLERHLENRRKAVCDAVFEQMRESWKVNDPKT